MNNIFHMQIACTMQRINLKKFHFGVAVHNSISYDRVRSNVFFPSQYGTSEQHLLLLYNVHTRLQMMDNTKCTDFNVV